MWVKTRLTRDLKKTRQSYITLHRCCAHPSPPFRLIPFAALATLFYFLRFPPTLPLPLRGLGPSSNTWFQLHISESSCQTSSRSVQPFLYGSQMICCTVHCQWGRTPQSCPYPLGFRYHAGGGPSHGHIDNMHREIGKDRACGSRDIRHTDRRAHHNTSPPFPRAK